MIGKERGKVLGDNRRRIIELCIENDVIANKKFKHRTMHKYRRAEPRRNEKCVIDYFLVIGEIWKKVKDGCVIRSAEVWSDHFLIQIQFKENAFWSNKKKEKL